MPKKSSVIKRNLHYQEITTADAVRHGTPWADWEINLVKAMRSKGMPIHRIALKLNRTWRAVESTVYRMGL